MQRGLMMLLFGGVFLLLGLFMMPMKRTNPKQNLVDNPIGWGLFGFGLSSLLVGITQAAKNREHMELEVKTIKYPVEKKDIKEEEEVHSIH
ncbi:hypothetical protein [Ammoniphilus sp. YIM 78166]|uniref:hypothetical protein n=1 Tax=Ammoniphilus sp. YIM 78166 TaxID=1644106 RepID=UPI00106FAADD|nr:hypothetical protein [Ammoniphilus sp. YIM 78166]